MFPDSSLSSYVLSIKRAMRHAENLGDVDQVTVASASSTADQPCLAERKTIPSSIRHPKAVRVPPGDLRSGDQTSCCYCGRSGRTVDPSQARAAITAGWPGLSRGIGSGLTPRHPQLAHLPIRRDRPSSASVSCRGPVFWRSGKASLPAGIPAAAWLERLRLFST